MREQTEVLKWTLQKRPRRGSDCNEERSEKRTTQDCDPKGHAQNHLIIYMI